MRNAFYRCIGRGGGSLRVLSACVNFSSFLLMVNGVLKLQEWNHTRAWVGKPRSLILLKLEEKDIFLRIMEGKPRKPTSL